MEHRVRIYGLPTKICSDTHADRSRESRRTEKNSHDGATHVPLRQTYLGRSDGSGSKNRNKPTHTIRSESVTLFRCCAERRSNCESRSHPLEDDCLIFELEWDAKMTETGVKISKSRLAYNCQVMDRLWPGMVFFFCHFVSKETFFWTTRTSFCRVGGRPKIETQSALGEFGPTLLRPSETREKLSQLIIGDGGAAQ
jgi:hypothetical protein